MTPDRIASILENVGLFRNGTVSQQFVRFECPFRRYNHESSSGIGGAHYWINSATLEGGCFVCKEHASLWEILKFIGLMEDRPSLVADAKKVLAESVDISTAFAATVFDDASKLFIPKLPSTFSFDGQIAGMHNPIDKPEAISYLEGRQYDAMFVITSFDLYFDSSERRIVQPLWDLYDGKVIGLMGRSVIGADPKMRHYYGTQKSETFGVSSSYEFWNAKRVIVVEGQFDMYRVYTALSSINAIDEFCVVSINGSRMSDAQVALLSKKFCPVYLMFDNDKAGKECTSHALDRLANQLPCLKVIRWETPEKDPDELKIDRVLELLLGVLK